MNHISIFELRGIQIEMLYNKGSLAYTFEKDGKIYGIKVKPLSKKAIDIASAAFQLFTNALSTMEELEKNENN